MPTEATRPRARVNVLGGWLSLAGFQVTIIGRIWVTPEVLAPPADANDVFLR